MLENVDDVVRPFNFRLIIRLAHIVDKCVYRGMIPGLLGLTQGFGLILRES
jgi:hypothetical protein